MVCTLIGWDDVGGTVGHGMVYHQYPKSCLDPTPGDEVVHKVKIFACMLLYISFPLI